MKLNTSTSFENKVKKTIKDYKLLSKKDKIIVACSGGKDSTTVLYLLKKFGYRVEGLMIDLLIGKWSNQNLENIKKFCKKHDIKLHVVNVREEFGGSMCFIRSKVQKVRKVTNCLVCGIIKRWLMNKKARELGATKLVTGHNLDDGAETVLMNLFKGNLQMNLGMGPAVGIVQDEKFVQRVKPLYFCSNEEIKKYSSLMKFPVLYDSCPCATEVFRRKIRRELSKKTQKEKENIVNTFLNLLPEIKKQFPIKNAIKYCSSCGEPCRKEICKMCELLSCK